MEDNRKPTLAREIGKVAWAFFKFIACAGALSAIYLWLVFHNHMVWAMSMVAAYFVAFICLIGRDIYRWKMESWKRRRSE